MQIEYKTKLFEATINTKQIYSIIVLMVLYLHKKYWVIDIDILKNGVMSINFEFCIVFYLKRIYGHLDNISINRDSCGHARFIIDTIWDNKHCITKLLFLHMFIIKYLCAQPKKLAITFMFINCGLIKPSVIIKVLSLYIYFLSFFRNVKVEMVNCYIFFFDRSTV